MLVTSADLDERIAEISLSAKWLTPAAPDLVAQQTLGQVRPR